MGLRTPNLGHQLCSQAAAEITIKSCLQLESSVKEQDKNEAVFSQGSYWLPCMDYESMNYKDLHAYSIYVFGMQREKKWPPLTQPPQCKKLT